MTYEMHVVNLPEKPARVLREHVGHDGIAAFLGRALDEIMAVLQGQHAQITGAPLRPMPDSRGRRLGYRGRLPVQDTPDTDGRTQLTSLPGGPIARTVHAGDHGALGNAYQAVQNRLTGNGYHHRGGPWESYLDGPEVATPRTEVFFPCRTDESAAG